MQPEDLRKGQRFIDYDSPVSVRNRNYRWKQPEVTITHIRRNWQNPEDSLVYYEDVGGNKYKTQADIFIEDYAAFITGIGNKQAEVPADFAVENINSESIQRSCPNCGFVADPGSVMGGVGYEKGVEIKCPRCGAFLKEGITFSMNTTYNDAQDEFAIRHGDGSMRKESVKGFPYEVRIQGQYPLDEAGRLTLETAMEELAPDFEYVIEDAVYVRGDEDAWVLAEVLKELGYPADVHETKYPDKEKKIFVQDISDKKNQNLSAAIDLLAQFSATDSINFFDFGIPRERVSQLLAQMPLLGTYRITNDTVLFDNPEDAENMRTYMMTAKKAQMGNGNIIEQINELELEMGYEPITAEELERWRREYGTTPEEYLEWLFDYTSRPSAPPETYYARGKNNED